MRGAIVVDTERCKGCNLCAVACPLNIIRLTPKTVNKKGYPYAEQVGQGMCTGCTWSGSHEASALDGSRL